MFNTILYYYMEGACDNDYVQECVPFWITQEQADQIIKIKATQSTQTTGNTNTTTTD